MPKHPFFDTHSKQSLPVHSQHRLQSTRAHGLGDFFTKLSLPNLRPLSTNYLWSQGNQQLKESKMFLLPFQSLNSKIYSRSLLFRRRLRPCFALEPTCEFSNLAVSRNYLWSCAARKTQNPKNVLGSLTNYKETQIIQTVILPSILTNTFAFGVYKLQKQTYKYKEPIRNICKYLVVYVVGSVCWLYYANLSLKIEKSDTRQGWTLAQQMVQRNLPLFKNNGLFLTKKAIQTSTLSPCWVMSYASSAQQGQSLCCAEGGKLGNFVDTKTKSLSLALLKQGKIGGFVQSPSCRKYQEDQNHNEVKSFPYLGEQEKAKKSSIFSTISLDPRGFVYKTLEQGLQNNYTFFRETNIPSSFFVHSSSINTVLGVCSNPNNFDQKPQLGPKPLQDFFQDKNTQNYIATIPVKGHLWLDQKRGFNGQNEIVQTKNLFFFARKPLFFKKERTSFLNAQMLSQKEQYLCSGTSIILGSEFDFLPRKIDSTGFYNQSRRTKDNVDNHHVKFSVEVRKMEKPKIYKFLSDVPLQSIQNGKLRQNFGFGLTASWGRACAVLAGGEKQDLAVLLGAPGATNKSTTKQSRLKALLPNFLNEPENCSFKLKTEEQTVYLQFLKSSFLSVRSGSHKPTTNNSLNQNPRDSWHEGFGAVLCKTSNSFESNYSSEDKSINQPISFQNRKGIEQKNFSRTLIMVGAGPKGGTKSTKKASNRTTIIKKKNLVKDQNLLEKFCCSRLQSGFNFPDAFLLNNPLVEAKRNGTTLKIKKTFRVHPRRSNISLFVKPFIKTDHPPFSIKPEFYGSNKKIELFNNLKINLSKNPSLHRTPLLSLARRRSVASKTLNPSQNSIKLPNLVKGLKNLTNSPESFFGTSYLNLGERFTIEKIKSKNQISFLNSVHNGDIFATSLKSTVPFVSTGTSLHTVFGKKALKQQSSKKAFKTQSPFTNARAVSQWNIIDFSKHKSYWFQKNTVQQNSETVGPNKTRDFKKNSEKNQKIANIGFVETQQKNINNLGYLLSPKRISGKVNRHLINPFKYYNPGTKRDRNIEDAMLTLEGYKKSRLFPTTHINYQGISSQFLNVSLSKKNQGQYLDTHTNQDIDLQSILSGLRQKNEVQRIAEKTIGPLYGNLGLRNESNLSLGEELGEVDNSTLTWENIEENRRANFFSKENDINLKYHENPIQKKNFRNTNNYPLGTLLAGASCRPWHAWCRLPRLEQHKSILGTSWHHDHHQTYCLKNLKATTLAEYNFTNLGTSRYFLDPNRPIIKFFEENFVENSQLSTIPLDSSRPNILSGSVKKAQDHKKHNSFLEGSNQTKGFYFEKIFATPFLRSQAKTFRFTAEAENTLSSTVAGKIIVPKKSTSFDLISWQLCDYQEKPRPIVFALEKTSFYSFIQNLTHKNTSISSLKNILTRVQVWGSFSKILFFSIIWSSYKLLATPLTISNFLPATFTEAIGLQSFQKKYRIITRGNTKVDFKNLAGIEKTLSELRDLIWTFRLVGTGGPYGEYSNYTHLPYLGKSFGQQRSSVFSKTRNRFLLVGPPGTGKTLLVKALATEANVPVIVQPVSQLRMISGVENPVSTLFHVARQIKPCIIFLDELDTLGTDINNSDKSSNTEQKIDIKLAQKYTYTLLLELDGLVSSTRDLLIIGATNRPETLNPALTRAGRFETVINCNLPSQEQRLALFSLYLPRGSGTDSSPVGIGHGAPLAELLKGGNRRNKKNLRGTISFGASETKGHRPMLPSVVVGVPKVTKDGTVLRMPQNPRSKYQKVTRHGSYLNYLTKIAYGLSQASIETAINQSALNSTLQGNHCHTFTTLEGAFNAVRELNSKTTTGKAFNSSWSFSRLVGQENSIRNLSSDSLDRVDEKSKAIVTKNTKYTSTKFEPKTNFYFKGKLSGKKEKKVGQKNLQFLICTAYQTTGSVLLYQKINSCSKKFFKAYLTSLFKRKQLTVYNNKDDLALQSFEFDLFQNYAGQACLNLYNGIRCQSLQFSHVFGLYKNPVQLGTTLFLLKNETDGYFSSRSKILSSAWSQQNAQVSLGQNGLLSTNQKQKNYDWCQNSKKQNENINTQQITSVQKTSSFFVNELSRQIRLSNPLKTGWFRLYLSRPIFRYGSSEYIENKEYYPKNNYSFYSKKPLQPFALLAVLPQLKKGRISKTLGSLGSRGQRFTHFINVATLSHQTTFDVSFSSTEDLSKPRIQQKAVSQVYEASGKSYRENYFVPQKFSLYLAIIAFIFHNALLFMQENRELADYCVYKKLRYGGLYEFYIDQVCQKFR